VAKPRALRSRGREAPAGRATAELSGARSRAWALREHTKGVYGPTGGAAQGAGRTQRARGLRAAGAGQRLGLRALRAALGGAPGSQAAGSRGLLRAAPRQQCPSLCCDPAAAGGAMLTRRNERLVGPATLMRAGRALGQVSGGRACSLLPA